MSTNGAMTLSGYAVLGEVGVGAGSRIYKARDPQTQQVVALKRIIRRSREDDKFIAQLETEWAHGQQIQDARVRQVIAIKKLRKLLSLVEVHLVMEYFDGFSLDRARPRHIPDILHIFRQTAMGLAAIHQAGLVHADMKPNNVLLDTHGRVKIIDLGQSSPIGKAKERIQGTPDYIAPEQVACQPLDERTDIYNLGATFYWVLTHQALPTALPAAATPGARAAAPRPAVPPHELRGEIHPALSKLVMDCCQVAPAARPKTIKQVLERLNMVTTVLQRHGGDLQTSFSRTGEMSLSTSDPNVLAAMQALAKP